MTWLYMEFIVIFIGPSQGKLGRMAADRLLTLSSCWIWTDKQCTKQIVFFKLFHLDTFSGVQWSWSEKNLVQKSQYCRDKQWKGKEKCNKCKYPVPPLAALPLLALALLRACFFLKMLSCDREDFFNWWSLKNLFLENNSCVDGIILV